MENKKDYVKIIKNLESNLKALRNLKKDQVKLAERLIKINKKIENDKKEE